LDGLLSDPTGSIEGTFWYGLNDANFPANMPRTIVFDVAGTIHMGLPDTDSWTSEGNAWTSQSRKGVSSDDLTIAGESAPGPVIFMGGTLKPQGNNQIYRNFTIAAGYGMKNFWEPDDPPPSPGTLPTSYTMDAMDISGQNILIDHLDAIYCTDEAISCNEFAENVTIQYCNNSQGQNYDGHAYGHLLQADTNHKISLLHNLDAHQKSRLPRVGSELGVGALNDFRNNVFYNWFGNSPGYAGSSQYSKNNFIHNFYLAGNGGDSSWQSTEGGGTGIFSGSSAAYTDVYPIGNLKDINKDGDPNDTSSADGNYSNSDIQAVAFNIDIGVTLGAKDSFTNVLRHVGPRWWERDYDITVGNTGAIDTPTERLVHEVITGTGRIEAWANDPYVSNSVEGIEWRALWALRPDTNGAAPFNHPADWDVDGDGIPGYWEEEHGLDPAVANNNADFDTDGYTDLEEYLHEVAAWPAPGEIRFVGDSNGRYAEILNWRVYGVNVNISGIGNLPTSSPWQPSRYDTAVISNTTVRVDSIGQRAGTLRLIDNATLNLTNGWLKIADTVEIGTASAATLNLLGGSLQAGTLTKGGAGIFNFTGGTLSAQIIHFDLTNEGGTLAPGQSLGQTVVNGDLTLQMGSSLNLELGASNTNDSDSLIVNGDLTLGGQLNISSRPGFGLGTYTLISYTGSLNGSLAVGSLPDGYAYALQTGAGIVALEVKELTRFNSILLDSGQIVLAGTGPTNSIYQLLAAPDLSQPPEFWTPIATNVIDALGQFQITNSMDTAQPQTFFRLRVP
jgi:hypothetical protein